MGNFKKPSVNKIKTTMESLQIYLRAEKKFGKSTLFRDIVLEKFGNPENGLLIGVGDEAGYTLLDELNATQVESAEEFVGLINWLIKEKGNEHDIKIIGVDVVDELFPLFERYMCKLSIKETGKPCKSINQAFGGYGEGQRRLVMEIKKIFTRLKKAGIGTFAIGHTKTKTIKKNGESEAEEYMILTSTLQNNYEAVFGDIFDVVATGVVEREVQDGIVASSSRQLVLRGDGFIDAGTRFADGSVPERIIFDKPNMAKVFIDVIEDGMRKSAKKKIDIEDFKRMQIEESNSNRNAQAEILELESVSEVIEDKTKNSNPELNLKLKKEIVPLYTKASKEKKMKIKTIIEKYGAKSLELDAPTAMFQEILDLFN